MLGSDSGADDAASKAAAAGSSLDASAEAAGRAAQPFDTVPYRPASPGLENHHGVMDKWAMENIDGYVSRASNNPTMALTKTRHDATKSVFRDWLFERTGKRVGGRIDWKNVSPREAQDLTERMFDAAGVPAGARSEYYRAFHEYIYRGGK